MTVFETLNSVNVNGHTEKKNGLLTFGPAGYFVDIFEFRIGVFCSYAYIEQYY